MAWLFLAVQVSHLAQKKTNARAMQEAIWPWSELEQRDITNEVLVSISRCNDRQYSSDEDFATLQSILKQDSA